MRLLVRNCTAFDYYKYTGLDSDLDENNLHTGIWKPVYAEPVTYTGNISSPSGAAVQAFDGLEIRYTHVLVMDNPDADISETGYIVWKGKTYDVTAVRPSLNVLSVALEQRTIDNGDQTIEDTAEEVSETGETGQTGETGETGETVETGETGEMGET